MLSVIVPARQEPYLGRTVEDLLAKAKGEIEVVVVCDGYDPGKIPQDDRVLYIRTHDRVGMRGAINRGVAASRGEYLMKIDAHCAMDWEYDRKLLELLESEMVLVPRRYRLDVEKWTLKGEARPPQYIERGTLKGRDWHEFAETMADEATHDIMTSQGSCWVMSREFWARIGGLDEENYGYMGREAQEVSLKTWTMGGRYCECRDIWYAHWDKPKEATIRDKGKEKSVAYAKEFWTEEKLARPVVERFWPVPSWEGFWTEEGVKADIPPGKPVKWSRKPDPNEWAERMQKLPEKELPFVRAGMNRRRFYQEVLGGAKVGAEIGVHRGRNAWLMLQEIPGLELILVDPYRPHPYGISRYDDKVYSKFRRYSLQRLQDYKVRWIYEFSEQAHFFVEDDSLDFVYIDADHSFSFVMLDIILWGRKVRPGGIIAGHDYYYGNKRQAQLAKVTAAVNAYTKAYRINPWFLTDPQVEDKEWGDEFPTWFWTKEEKWTSRRQ